MKANTEPWEGWYVHKWKGYTFMVRIEFEIGKASPYTVTKALCVSTHGVWRIPYVCTCIISIHLAHRGREKERECRKGGGIVPTTLRAFYLFPFGSLPIFRQCKAILSL